ncbi:MAG: hypothetical protein SO142_03250 [Prevotella sp.]|nr:hypothetical protein [Prevotella sp.]
MIKIKFTGRNYNDIINLPCVLMVSKVLDGEIQAAPHAVVRHRDGSFLMLECGDTIILEDKADERCLVSKPKKTRNEAGH